MVWHWAVYYRSHLRLVSVELTVYLGLVEGQTICSDSNLFYSSWIKLLDGNKIYLRRDARTVGRQVYCLRCFLYGISFAYLVASFGVSINDKDDIVCRLVCDDSYDSDLLEVTVD